MPVFAAVDIGSNSVRLDVVEVTPGQAPRLLVTERGVARLGESVFRTGEVSEAAIETVCGILRRMAALCAPFELAASRAVATSALRDARNQAAFLASASAALGMPVEIISGDEEARLIHRGVQSRESCSGGRCLVIDVGGGSTEVIFGGREGLVQAWSLPLGAIRLREGFIGNDPPLPEELAAMERFIGEQTAPVLRALAGFGGHDAIGTSATARSLTSAVRPPGTVQIRRFYRSISGMNLACRRAVEGIGPQRAEIIIPGTAVLLHLLEGLGMRGLSYSAGCVRDGIIADLSSEI